MIIPIDKGAFQEHLWLPDRQFEVDSIICVHFTRILTAAHDGLMTLIPYKRIGEPEEIGRLAAFLASDYADYITGVSIFVDAGMSLYPGFETGG